MQDIWKKIKHYIDREDKKRSFHKGKIIKLSNNRLERVNRFYALWLHVCRGLKSFETAEIWIGFFTVNYTYLKERGERMKRVKWEKIPEIAILSLREKYHLLT